MLSGKLLQLANGFAYTDDGAAEIHSEKLDALAEIADTATGPLLVAYTFKEDLRRLRERFPSMRAIDDPGALDAWIAGEFEPGQIMAAHPASAGHGLNLQSGGCAIVWFGLSWSLELHQQFNARLHRQGQTKPVVVHYLVVEGTIDQDVILALEAKHDAQEILLNALRRRIPAAETVAA